MVKLVAMTIVNIFNICYNIKAMCFGGHWHCGWQGQPGGGDHGGQWHGCIISVSVIGLSLLPTGVHCLLLHLDGVINLCVVTHIENFKHLSVPTINTTYHSQCPVGTRTRPATRYFFSYPTQFSFGNHRVAGNPKHRVLPDISGKPEVSGTTRYFGYHP